MKQTLRLFFLVLSIGLWNANYSQNDSLHSRFSIRGGLYDTTSLIVSIDTIGYKVFFTLDGSKPNLYANAYSKPFELDTITIIRAAFYKNGKRTGIATQSYIIGRTFDMAVVSIAIKPDDFFGYSRGIYVKGCCADSVQPYKRANFWKGWEREINIEFYEPDNSLGFNQPGGIRIFGGYSKGLPMKSLAIFAKTEYGPNKFKYQIFPNKDIKKFKSFILRSSGGDFNKTHFRDALLTDLVAPLDLEIQAYRPAVVYINGAYWGIHNIREKITEHYLRYNCGANKDSVDLMKHRNDLQAGNRKSYKALIRYINSTDFSDTSNIRHLNTLMDIDNYINYNLAEIYSDNGDAGGNIRYWREQKDGARWRWILFDLDLGMGIGDWKAYKVNTLKEMTTKTNEKWPNPDWATLIIRKLLENDSIKEVYINRFADHLNTIFSSENVNFKIDSIKNLINNEFPLHIQKWPVPIEKWERNITKIKDFATYRPSYLRRFIMNKFNLQDTILVQLDSINSKQGYVKLNSLNVNKTFNGWYFEGCPIYIEAIPYRGYEFIKWIGTTDSTSKLVLSLTEDITLTPLFKKKEFSQYQGDIVINEISFKQDSTQASGDWIEFYNVSKDTISLSGWELTTKDDELFKFPESSYIFPNDYFVVCKSRADYLKYYDDYNLCKIDMGFGFSSKKDKIIIVDANLQTVDSLYYNIKKEYIELKNKSLQKTNPTKGSKIENWIVNKKTTPAHKNEGFTSKPKPTRTRTNSNNYIYIGLMFTAFFLIATLLIVAKKKMKTDD